LSYPAEEFPSIIIGFRNSFIYYTTRPFLFYAHCEITDTWLVG
jgi:hypothetical protein